MEKRKTSQRWWSLILAFLFLFGPVFPSVTLARATTVVEADKVLVDSGGSASVGIRAIDVPSPGLAGFNIKISYNPDVAQITSIDGPDPVFATDAFFDSSFDNTQGVATIAGARADGVTGTFRLATLNFTAVGAPGDETDLVVSIEEFVDPKPASIPVSPVNGKFSIRAPLTIITEVLPEGTVGVPYSATLQASGGTSPYSWSITSGNLPPGLSLNSDTGVISGTPTTEGTFDFTVQVADSSSPPQTASKPLSIKINPAPAPDIDVNPTSINFGNVTANTSSPPQTVTVSNIGNADLVVGQVIITGTNAAEFSIQNDDVSGKTITPGGSATLQVVFSPTSQGAKSASLSIPSNDPDEATVIVSLSGIGVALPSVALSSANYTVGEGEGSATITVNLSAPSNQTVTVNYATSDGTATAGQDYETTSGTLTFNPGETSKSFTIPILEDSLVEGDETVNLALSNPVNATLGSPYTAILTIADNDPDIDVSPTSIDFGKVLISTSSLPQTVTVSNVGYGALNVSQVTITGTNAAEFSIQNDDVSGKTITPGGSATLQVVFSPTSQGAKSASLSIPSNDPDEPQVTVSLSGTGVTPSQLAEEWNEKTPEEVASEAEALPPVGAARVFEEMDPGKAADALERMETGKAADVFEEMEPAKAGERLRGIELPKVAEIAREMEPGKATEAIKEMLIPDKVETVTNVDLAQEFTEEAPLDAKTEADIKVSFKDTEEEKGSGDIKVRKYPEKLKGSVGFQEKTGRIPVKTIDLEVPPTFTKGTATIKVYYTDAEIAELDETTLRLYYWDGTTWRLAENQSVNTAENFVQGDVPVAALSGTAIGIGGTRRVVIVAPPSPQEIISYYPVERAIEEVKRVGVEEAARILGTVRKERAGEVLEKLDAKTRTEIVLKMSTDALKERLPEVSPEKLYEIPLDILLQKLPDIPTEHLIKEIPPVPPPDLPSAKEIEVTPTSASYQAPEARAEKWVSFFGGSIEPFTSFALKPSKDLKNVEAKIEVLREKPAEIIWPTHGYPYLSLFYRIELKNISPEEISAARLTFKLKKELLEFMRHHKWSILFNRWEEKTGTWVTIPTKRIGEDRDFVYYSTITSKFSIFTITVSREIPAPKFRLSNLSISPTEAVAGKEVSITADITNLTDKEEVYTAILWINGTAEKAKEIRIPGGKTLSVSFTVVKDAEGKYEVRIDRLTGILTIKPDNIPPIITAWYPRDFIEEEKPVIGAEYLDEGLGIEKAKVMLLLDGEDLTSKAEVTKERISYVPVERLKEGEHVVKVIAADLAGNEVSKEWSFTIVVGPTFPGQEKGARDLDRDGRYEDINGNGKVDFDDVVVFFKNIDFEVVRKNIGLFDFNNNGRIDYDDVVKLFRMV